MEQIQISFKGEIPQEEWSKFRQQAEKEALKLIDYENHGGSRQPSSIAQQIWEFIIQFSNTDAGVAATTLILERLMEQLYKLGIKWIKTSDGDFETTKKGREELKEKLKNKYRKPKKG